MDGWFIEEERVFAHLRDPYHRVDVHESSRPVEVRRGRQLIARSSAPSCCSRPGWATRVYVPRADIAAGVLSQAEKRTECPYKGEATYWSLPGIADAAWSYEAPLPEAVEDPGARLLRRRGRRGGPRPAAG